VYTAASLKYLVICIVSTFRKTNGKDGQDYKVLLHIVVAGICGAAAGCLCRERLGERERTLYFHIIHISEDVLRKMS
jgi:hypothetical protein